MKQAIQTELLTRRRALLEVLVLRFDPPSSIVAGEFSHEGLLRFDSPEAFQIGSFLFPSNAGYTATEPESQRDGVWVPLPETTPKYPPPGPSPSADALTKTSPPPAHENWSTPLSPEMSVM